MLPPRSVASVAIKHNIIVKFIVDFYLCKFVLQQYAISRSDTVCVYSVSVL